MKPFKQYVQEAKHNMDYGMPGYNPEPEYQQAAKHLINMVQTDEDYIRSLPAEQRPTSIVYNHNVLTALENHYLALHHGHKPQFGHLVPKMESFKKTVSKNAPWLVGHMDAELHMD